MHTLGSVSTAAVILSIVFTMPAEKKSLNKLRQSKDLQLLSNLTVKILNKLFVDPRKVNLGITTVKDEIIQRRDIESGHINLQSIEQKQIKKYYSTTTEIPRALDVIIQWGQNLLEKLSKYSELEKVAEILVKGPFKNLLPHKYESGLDTTSTKTTPREITSLENITDSPFVSNKLRTNKFENSLTTEKITFVEDATKTLLNESSYEEVPAVIPNEENPHLAIGTGVASNGTEDEKLSKNPMFIDESIATIIPDKKSVKAFTEFRTDIFNEQIIANIKKEATEDLSKDHLDIKEEIKNPTEKNSLIDENKTKQIFLDDVNTKFALEKTKDETMINLKSFIRKHNLEELTGTSTEQSVTIDEWFQISVAVQTTTENVHEAMSEENTFTEQILATSLEEFYVLETTTVVHKDEMVQLEEFTTTSPKGTTLNELLSAIEMPVHEFSETYFEKMLDIEKVTVVPSEVAVGFDEIITEYTSGFESEGTSLFEVTPTQDPTKTEDLNKSLKDEIASIDGLSKSSELIFKDNASNITSTKNDASIELASERIPFAFDQQMIETSNKKSAFVEEKPEARGNRAEYIEKVVEILSKESNLETSDFEKISSDTSDKQEINENTEGITTFKEKESEILTGQVAIIEDIETAQDNTSIESTTLDDTELSTEAMEAVLFENDSPVNLSDAQIKKLTDILSKAGRPANDGEKNIKSTDKPTKTIDATTKKDTMNNCCNSLGACYPCPHIMPNNYQVQPAVIVPLEAVYDPVIVDEPPYNNIRGILGMKKVGEGCLKEPCSTEEVYKSLDSKSFSGPDYNYYDEFIDPNKSLN